MPLRATPVAWPGRLAPGVGPIPWPASLRAAQSTQGPFLTPLPRRNMIVASQSGRICGKARPTSRSTGTSRVKELELENLCDNLSGGHGSLGRQLGLESLPPNYRLTRGHSTTYIALRNLLKSRCESRIDPFLELVNRYFDCTAGAVMSHGGEVLRFIGDAVLAIFPLREGVEAVKGAADSAMESAREAELRLEALNAERRKESQDAIDFGLGLHVGGTQGPLWGPSPNRPLCGRYLIYLAMASPCSRPVRSALRSSDTATNAAPCSRARRNRAAEATGAAHSLPARAAASATRRVSRASSSVAW